MKVEELLRCQIQEWYPNFKSFSIKTLIHHLPDPFLHYLLQDDGPFLLPASSSGRDPFPRHRHHDPSDDTTLKEDDPGEEDRIEGDPDGPDDDDHPPDPPCFSDLESDVQNSIASLGGAVFPKLNWSAPRDAASMGAAGTLRCTSFTEIALLLKSSDRVSHDLCHALDSCSDREEKSPPAVRFHLALRKWYDSLRPEMEFRCFVRWRRLIGVCQREVTTFYSALLEKRYELGPLIGAFFQEIVRPRFESEAYTFDVYVTGDGRVKVLDFNPWGTYTLPLLFEWEELEREGFEGDVRERVDFRIVESQCGVRPGLKTTVPFDYLDVGEGSGWDQFFKRADEELQRQAHTPEASA